VSDFLLFVVVLGTLIIGHEFGHFIAARLLGIPVEEFGIGFPPRIATLFESGGTKFTLNLIPFGGFVRPLGEDDPDVPGGLSAASKRVRAAVFAAGPLANVILAFIAFIFAFKYAAPDFNRIMITDIVAGAPAEGVGIQIGDIVRSVEDKEITSFETILEVVSAHLGEPIVMELDRKSQPILVELTPRTEYPNDQGPLGVTLGYPARPTTWTDAASLSWDSIRLQVNAIVGLPARLISGSAMPEEARVSGLKGIHDMLSWASSIDRSSQRPFLTLNLVGIISLGLALANLIPIPIMDGGRLLFILIEAIIGRRIPPRYEGLAQAIGLAILLFLMVYINLQDFINPITLP
jgi:regulator of sigma E protease